MAEFTISSSPTTPKRPVFSSFFGSPRLFTTFVNPKLEPDSVMSPTSTLDTKPFSHIRNPFSSEPEPAKARPWEKPDSQGIGLGIVSDPKESKRATRMVLFGSHLKIQIPVLPETQNGVDFGIRTRNSYTGSGLSTSPYNSTRVPSGSFSTKEMELSEEYTCVIMHGPNPKTTHIFDNCVVCEKDGDRTVDGLVGCVDRTAGFVPGGFLSFCCTCKRKLGHGKDIYMYRGEKAFCSHECRYEEMLLEEVNNFV